MAAEVLVQDGTFQVGKIHELAAFHPGARFKTYDPTADGRRFLVVELPDTRTPPLTLVANWTSEIEGR